MTEWVWWYTGCACFAWHNNNDPESTGKSAEIPVMCQTLPPLNVTGS